MAQKKSKRFRELLTKMDTKKVYSVVEALSLLKSHVTEKFIPSIDIAVKLNLNPTKPEQQLRGTFTLPYTVSKEIRVLVIDDAFTKDDAKLTGADHYGSLDKIDEIKQG